MPGLVNPCTSLGLKPFNRSGVHADLKTGDAFSMDEKLYTKLLRCGFTTFGLLPPGSGFPGQAMAFKPEGVKKEDWMISDSAYVLVTMTRPSREKKAFKSAFETAQKEIDKVEKARKEWEEKQKKKKEEEEKKKAEPEKKEEKPKGTAPEEPEKKTPPEKGKEGEKAEEEPFKPPPINPAYQPLVDMIQKKEGVRMLIVLDQASDFIHLKEVLGEHEYPRSYLLKHAEIASFRSASSDLYRVAGEFGEERAKVVMKPAVNVKPYTRHRICLPRTFAEAGCEVSLMPARDTLEEHAAFLNRVGLLIKAGLTYDEALRAVTLHPARILGVDDRMGTLEEGKMGNLLFLDGEPFHPLTRVKKVMIEGRVVAEGLEYQ